MSIGYAISATLDPKPSINNIEFILQKVARNGFTLWQYEFGILEENLSTILDPKTAALQIWDGMEERKKGDDDAHSGVVIKYGETYCGLSFYRTEENNLMVFLDLRANVKKRHNDRWTPDFAHYIKFLLMACEDFYIVKIETIAT